MPQTTFMMTGLCLTSAKKIMCDVTRLGDFDSLPTCATSASLGV